MIIFFDTETTGLLENSNAPLSAQPRVIEFYGEAADPETREVAASLHFLCDPGFPLPEIITKITGLRTADVKGKPEFEQHWEELTNFLAPASLFVAHNIAFDLEMIRLEFARILAPDPFPPGVPTLCTVLHTEWMKGHRLSLGALYAEVFGAPFECAHRAREDVQALRQVYFELRKRGDI